MDAMAVPMPEQKNQDGRYRSGELKKRDSCCHSDESNNRPLPSGKRRNNDAGRFKATLFSSSILVL